MRGFGVGGKRGQVQGNEQQVYKHPLSHKQECLTEQYCPVHDKTNKMTCAPSQDSGQPGHWFVFAVHSVGSWGLSVSSCRQWRLWSAGAAGHIGPIVVVFHVVAHILQEVLQLLSFFFTSLLWLQSGIWPVFCMSLYHLNKRNCFWQCYTLRHSKVSYSLATVVFLS